MPVALRVNPITNSVTVQQLDDYQRTANQVLQLLEEEKKILHEKMDLIQKENRRDQKRRLFEFYDKHYKKMMIGVGGVALAAVFAAGASTYVTLTQPEAITLTTAQTFARLSGPVTGSLLAGSGLMNLLIRAGYFMDCNGKFQEMRRGRDAVKQALVQMEDYNRTRELRRVNEQLASLSPERLKLIERWKIRKLVREIDQLEKRIGRSIKKMDKRDLKTYEKEEKEVGKKPSHILMNMESEKIAQKKFDELGIGSYANYFLGRQEEGPNKKSSVRKQIWKPIKVSKIEQKIRNKLRSTNKPLTAQERRLQTCEQMRNELPGGPKFPALFALTQREVDRTREWVHSHL